MTDFSFEMKNIVICQINSRYIHSSLAAWYIYAGVKEYSKSDVTPVVVEGTINEKTSLIADRIINESPCALGLSTYIWNARVVLEVASLVKKALPQIKVILGGPEVSYSSEKYLSYDFIDFVVSGEGEYPFARLIDVIVNETNISNIPGVSYKNEGNIVISEPYVSADIPPSPYCDEYFEAIGNRIAYLETSRGCPFSCAFCLSGKCGGVRFFPEERAKRELLSLAKSGTATIKLVDRTFNADKKRAIRFFEFIRDNYGTEIPEGVRIHFEISGEILDGETIRVIGTLPKGAVQFEVGIQSFNVKTLEAIGRKSDTTRLVENTNKLISLGNVHVHTDLIAGLPFEDYKSFRNSFNLAFAMRPHMLQLGFLKVLSGSPMGDDDYPHKCTFSPDAPYEVISTDYISSSELDVLRKIEDLNERIYNSGRFVKTFDYVLEVTELTPFDLYEKLSSVIEYDSGTSLDGFTKALCDVLVKIGVTDVRRLYDTVILDRITTNREGRIPEFLKGEHQKTVKVKKKLEETVPDLFASGVKSCISYLESMNVGVYVRYDSSCDSITGKYPENYIRI